MRLRAPIERRGAIARFDGSLFSRVHCWRAVCVLTVIALFAGSGFSGDFVLFGPRTYTRATGAPVTVTNSFQVLNPSVPFTLVVENHGVTSAVISVDGQSVLGPSDFTGASTATATLRRPVILRAGANQIAVELRGQPGTSLTIQIVGTDNVPPSITATPSTAPNANGWNKTTVTVSFTCSDAGSGIATCPVPVVVSAEGANQVISGTAVDKAGNTTTSSLALNIDKTPPVVTATPSPGPNANGWNNSAVVVTFAATDALSGVAPGSVTAPVTLSANGTNLSASGQATDLAGNAGSVTRTGVNIDQTTPNITVALTPAANVNGWNTAAVTAHFTCTDTGSGVAVCPADQLISSQGANQTAAGTTTDRAGNSASVTSPPFNIEFGGPTITATVNPPPNAAGWNTSAVTVHFTCSDPISGIVSCPPDQQVTTEGANQRVTGVATNGAGTTANVSATVNMDLHPPVVSAGSPQTITLPAGVSLTGSVTDNGLPTGAVVSSLWTKFSGPGAVAFANAASPVTTATLDQTGTYVLRLTASDTAATGFSDVTITVNPPLPTNQAPLVSAGSAQTITLPAGVSLTGSVTDDGLPAGATVSSLWTKFSGPGAVTFGAAANPATTATFDQAGTYVLRLTASDTERTAFSDVAITVNPALPTNQAPLVSAGSAQTITLPAGVSLTGSVTDDGLPAGATVSSLWTKFSGPGAVTFGNAANPVTTATFDQAGTYVLRLTASDTTLTAFTDVTITVNPAPPTNQAPLVSAGSAQTVTAPAGISLTGSVTDDGLPAGAAVSSLWTKFSGPGAVIFGNAASPVTTATFDQTGTYVLRLTASDTVLTAFSDVTITVNPPGNHAPVITSTPVTSGKHQFAYSYQVTASDADGDTFTYSLSIAPVGMTIDPAAGLIDWTPKGNEIGDQAVTVVVTDSKAAIGTQPFVVHVIDATPPFVRLTVPATVQAGNPVTATAEANDNVNVASVTLEVNSANPTMLRAPPFQKIIAIPSSALPGAIFHVRATALDGAGNTASDEKTITVVAAPDTQNPTVSLNAPPQAAAGATITVSALAADNAGVSLVAFTVNDAPLSSDPDAPYEAQYTIAAGTPAGTIVRFAARALDPSGNFADASASLTVTDTPDTTPPVVDLMSPPSVPERGTLAILSNASDNVGVAHVAFFVNGVQVDVITAAPFQTLYRLPPSIAGGDRLHIEARARDFTGLEASATADTLVVAAPANRPPTAAAGGPYAAQAGDSITFSSTGTSDPDQDPLTIDWDFGDGGTASGTAPAHAYTSAGNFTVTIHVSDGNGGSSSATASAVISIPADTVPPVVTLAGPSSVLPGAHVTMTAFPSDDKTVAGVTFLVNGSDSRDVVAAPYQRVVDVPTVATPGDAIIVRATARDGAGNTGFIEKTLTIVAQPDTENPTVTLMAPPRAGPGGTMHLVASASDNVGVQSVAFIVNGSTIASIPGAPFETDFQIDGAAVAGTAVSVVARAADYSGNHADASATVDIVATSQADNQPPTVKISAPGSVLAGGTIAVSADASDNVGVGSVMIFVDNVKVATFVAPPYETTFSLSTQPPGATLHLLARALDLSGHDATDAATTEVLAAGSLGQGVLIGLAYDDTNSLPVSGATVSLGGKDSAGNAYTQSTTTDSLGRYVLHATEGQSVVTITGPAWTRVQRSATISANQALQLFDARITPIGSTPVALSPVLGGTVSSGGVDLTVPAGALQTTTALTVTPVGAQGLEGLLPPGWSPLAAIDIAPHGIGFAGGATASLVPKATVSIGTPLVLATWDETVSQWRAVDTRSVTNPAARLQTPVTASGEYAWLVADATPAAPPIPAAGDPVTGVLAVQIPAAVNSSVNPQPKILFYKPGIHSEVRGSIDAAGALPSGTPAQARITESYIFTSGAEAHLEPFVEDVVAYQLGAGTSTVAAGFPVTPSLTFDPITLQQGVISVELFAPSGAPRIVSIVGPSGGSITASTGEVLQVPAGAVTDTVPVQIHQLGAGGIGVPLPATLAFVGAVDLSFTGAFGQAASLSIAKPGAITDSSQLLVVRIQEIGGQSRLVFVGAAKIVGNQIVSDATPAAGVVADGIRASGRYVFVRSTTPIAFAVGTVLGVDGGAAAGVLITSSNLPVVALTRVSGSFATAVATGAFTLTALDLQKSDSGSVTATAANPRDVVQVGLQLVAQVPRVVATVPSNNATAVPLADPMLVTFSEPIDPSTVNGASAANVLLTAPDGSAIAGTISLSVNNTSLTFRPASALASNTAYALAIAQGIRDRSGNPLAAAVTVHFTTLDTSPPPLPPAGSITASIPDANGQTTIVATQGTAGLHDTVTVFNLTRQASSPVLIDPNGGFTVKVAAGLTDKLQIVITGRNGGQTKQDLPRFTRTNADGSLSVAIGPDGGRVLGAGGTAVDIATGTFPDGAVVTIKPIAEASFPVQLSPDQRAVFGYSGGFELDFDGAAPTRYVNVSIPAGPDDSAEDQWIVSQVAQVNGETVLNMVDTAKLIDQRVTTSSPPCPGVAAAGVYGVHKSGRPVGLTFGTMSPTLGGIIAKVDVPFVAVPFLLPFLAFDLDAPIGVCLPVLGGRVTVSSNTVQLAIGSDQIRADDDEVAVKNITTAGESHFSRDDLEYPFIVAGGVTDTYIVNATTPTGTSSRSFRSLPDQTGTVKILLPVDAITSDVSEVVVKNQSLSPVPETHFLPPFQVKLTVAGGAGESYSAVASNDSTGDRPLVFGVNASSLGPQNLVLRALPGTIDPTRAEIDAYNAAHPTNPITGGKARTGVDLIDGTAQPPTVVPIPPAAFKDGGITFAFDGNISHQYSIRVSYEDGTSDSQQIPQFRVTVTNSTGNAVKVIVLPSPPKNQPLNLGWLSDDTVPPRLSLSLVVLQNFDPSGFLTLTFSEPMDAAAITAKFKVYDRHNHRVAGQIIISDMNQSVTFLPAKPFELAEVYRISLVGLVDRGGNFLPPGQRHLTLKTVAPRLVGSLHAGTNPGRPLEGLRDIQIQKKTVGVNRQTNIVAVTDSQNAYKFLTIDVGDPTHPVEKGHSFAAPTKYRLALVPDVMSLNLAGLGGCSSSSATFSGDLGLTTTFNTYFSFVSFWDVTDRDNPCLMGNKLLTANPEVLSDFGRRGTVHALGFAKGVAALKHTQGYAAYTAVAEVGLMATDVGKSLPEPLPDQRQPDGIIAGDYTDVVAAEDRLLALNHGDNRLEIVDPNLAILAGVDLPDAPRRVLYVPGLPFDANKNGKVEPGEHIDAAFVGGDTSVAIVDVTDIGNPRIAETIPIPSIVRDVDVDRAKRRLFVAGFTSWFIVDLAKAQTIGLVDADSDGIDDRIAWSGALPDAIYSLKVDTDTNHIYVGTSKGLEVYDLGAPNLTGKATFTFVPTNPANPAVGLDYANLTVNPIRGAIVELRDSAGSVLQVTNTDETGYYSFDAPVGSTVQVVVRAELGVPGHETVKVIDNTNANKVWEKASPSFVMPASHTENVYAETQWVPQPAPMTSYPKREAAPFAILDMVFQAQKTVRGAAPGVAFPLLNMAWSPKNQPSTVSNKPTGLIKTSHYASDEGTLYILGAENVDTDEYDSLVVLHEWSHYFEDKFSRSDSVGSPHTTGDLLDPRVAFGEGFATSFASMLINNPNYIDTSGPQQAAPSLTNLETDSDASGGFFAEDSVQELLWDLYDGKGPEADLESGANIQDDVELGFKPIYDVMVNGERTTPAFTSIFSFLNHLAAPYLADPALKASTGDKIVALAKAENIDLVNADEFELFNNVALPGQPGSQMGRLYTVLPVNGTEVTTFGPGPFAGQTLQTSTTFDAAGDGNKLFEYVFFKFTIVAAGNYKVQVVPTDNKALYFTVIQNGTPANSTFPSNLGVTQSLTLAFQPGTYSVAVRARDVVGGSWGPAAGQFKIQVSPVP